MTAYGTGIYKIFHKKSEKLNVETGVKIRLPVGPVLGIDTAPPAP